MAWRALILMTAFAALVAACGPSGTQTVPNNKPAANTTPVIAPATTPNTAKGANLATVYEASYREAAKAVQALGENLNAQTYAAAGAKVYNTLKLGILHERNGHDLSQLRSRTAMGEVRKSWLSLEGRLSTADKLRYKEIPEFKSAFESYKEAQQSE